MINVSRFTCIRKAEIFIVTGMEDLACPCCGEKLFVHGTCKRHLKATGGNAILRLRVMECERCRTTHREMPKGIVPYRRYSAEMLCVICSGQLMERKEDSSSIDTLISSDKDEYASDACICDVSVTQRIIKWLSWFLACAQNMEEIRSDYSFVSDSLCDQLKHCVRIIVNSGKWKQHHFAVPSS